MSNYSEMSLRMHEENKGKIEVISKVKVESKEDLSIAYTPGVAEPCREIHRDAENVYKYTSKGNLVAVVTDGSAVLGLGDIGPEAALPVMEGKAILFKEFANVDAFPLCLNTRNVDEIVETVKRVAPTFGGINLEDIGAPRCFEVEKRLIEELDIPVFHDDQHGTAIVVLAGLINGLKIVGKNISDLKIIINGAGAAGSAIANLLMAAGGRNIIVCDRQGALYTGRVNMNHAKIDLAADTNPNKEGGSLEDVMKGADVFIGVSTADAVSVDMVKSMNRDAIILAMANPIPEIMPDLAKRAGARIIGTGRSDFPNQINNVLVFPGVFRGALDVRAREINLEMKIAAAHAIADYIDEEDLNEENIIPSALDKKVAEAVAKAIADAAIKSKVARI